MATAICGKKVQFMACRKCAYDEYTTIIVKVGENGYACSIKAFFSSLQIRLVH